MEKKLLERIQQARQEQWPEFIFDRKSLTELPAEIGQLTALQALLLGGNRLSELPAAIGQLANLRRLILWGNQLSELPAEIGQLTNLQILDLRGDQLKGLPPEILARVNDPAAILTYYFENVASQAVTRPLSEAKVLLVGQGYAGKTSLIKRLIYDDFKPDELKTDGIDIHEWKLPINDSEVRLNVWDFGGQEVYRATHQFFLTKRSLYLLVLNARQDEQENRVDEWLRLIQAFGGDSPVIIVTNQVDEHPADIDEPRWRYLYPNIANFASTSCRTGQGIDDLRMLIRDQIDQMPLVHAPFNRNWFAVKMHLQTMERDTITYQDYQDICQKEEVEESDSQRTLVGFLHDLGVVVKYDDRGLGHTYILNPEWVTDGVYAIFNEERIWENRGLLRFSWLSDILDPGRYQPEHHDFIIAIMKKFQLCYEYEGREWLLIPALLPQATPEEVPDYDDDCLQFIYRFNILPGNIMARFIVHVGHMIQGELVWRNGVVIADGRNEAMVTADKDAGRVLIRVAGNSATRKDFLSLIRLRFRDILETLPGLEVKEIVPVPGMPGVSVPYDHLLKLHSKGLEEVFPVGGEDYVSIKWLLDGIETRAFGGRQTQGDTIVNVAGDLVQQKYVGMTSEEVTANCH